MNQLPLWCELLNRLGAVGGGSRVLISKDELRNWPASEFRLLRQAGLLARTKPATAAICPGCEEQCAMLVHSLTLPTGKTKFFIACDKRDDTARILLAADHLEQWKCTINQVLDFITASLGIVSATFTKLDTGRWEIGMAFGSKRHQMLCLEKNGLQLVAGNESVPLTELVVVANDVLALNLEKVRKLIDASTTGDPRYTPSTVKREARKLETQVLHASWRKKHEQLRKDHPGMSKTWYAKKIEKMPIAQGKKMETIRKNMG